MNYPKFKVCGTDQSFESGDTSDVRGNCGAQRLKQKIQLLHSEEMRLFLLCPMQKCRPSLPTRKRPSKQSAST